MKKMCCKQMQYYTSNHCTIHNSPFECPDWLLLYEEESDNYGIIIHDGGQSVVKKILPLVRKQALNRHRETNQDQSGDGSLIDFPIDPK
jgi:hypothetical protein